MPDPMHLPAPAELAPAVPWKPKHLATPEQLRDLAAPQRRRRVPAVPVLRVARRGGRRGL
jgi:hypothetical protein